MDDAANTGNLKKWAGEYREKIAQAETIESNLKIKDQQIQELESPSLQYKWEWRLPRQRKLHRV